MFTFDKVEQELITSHWPKPAVEKLQPVLPRLGTWALSHVWTQLNSTNGDVAAKYIADVISQEPTWYEDLQSGNIDPIEIATQNILNSQSEFAHKALLAVILDVRSNKGVGELVPQKLSALFDSLEIKYITDLPPFEIFNMLHERINHVVAVGDLAMEIKRYCYYRDAMDVDDVEITRFKQALDNNKQLIGAEPKTVKQWIDDFMQSAAASPNRSTYNVAYYTTNSPDVKKLGVAERAALAEILKLYYWLLQPYVSEEEIVAYEQQKTEAEELSVAQPMQQAPVTPATPKPVQMPDLSAERPNVKYEQPQNTQRAAISREIVQQQTQPKAVQPTEEQKRVLEEIRRAEHKSGKYNSQDHDGSSELSGADNARIHDLINQKLTATKRGVTIDPTNIKMAEEKLRMDQETSQKIASIQTKLKDLRDRNKK